MSGHNKLITVQLSALQSVLAQLSEQGIIDITTLEQDVTTVQLDVLNPIIAQLEAQGIVTVNLLASSAVEVETQTVPAIEIVLTGIGLSGFGAFPYTFEFELA